MSQRVPCYEIMARGRGRQFPLVRPASSSHRWTAGHPDSRTAGQSDSRTCCFKTLVCFQENPPSSSDRLGHRGLCFLPYYSGLVRLHPGSGNYFRCGGRPWGKLSNCYCSAVQFPSVKRGLREESCVGMYSHLTSLDKTGKLSQLNRSVTAKLWN